MNKSLLLILLVILAVLVVVFVLRQDTSNEPLNETRTRAKAPYAIEPTDEGKNGIQTSEMPRFDMQVIAVPLSDEVRQNRLRVSVTETHGWWVTKLSISCWHRAKDPASGQWSRDSDKALPTYVIKDVIRFDRPAEDSFPVSPGELDALLGPGASFGTSENWECEVLAHGTVFKPAG